MPSGSDKTRALSLRALIIFCALLSLCVSDTVGPRLLPLPASASGSAATAWQAADGADVTPAPSGGETAVVRVAMAAPGRKQAGAEHQPLHDAARAAEVLLTVPAVERQPAHTSYYYVLVTSAAVSRPPGRAPPLSA